MSADTTPVHGKLWKYDEVPHKVKKLLRGKVDKRQDEKDRDVIRDWYKRRCFVCGRKSTTVHEHKRRGAGGVVSLTNSFVGCDVSEGGMCHPLLQARQIVPLVGSEPLEIGGDVRTITGFRMTEKTHRLVFSHRSVPSHIEIQD